VTQSSSRFSAVSQPSVSLLRRFCDTKTLDGKIWYFGPKTSSEHTTKWAPLGPLKPSIPRSTRRVRAHIPIEQPTIVTLSVWGCLRGRSVRGVQGSSAEGRPYVLYLAYGTKDKNSMLGTKRIAAARAPRAPPKNHTQSPIRSTGGASRYPVLDAAGTPHAPEESRGWAARRGRGPRG
jgi:hypothetical protein